MQNSPSLVEPARITQQNFLKKCESRLETKSYRLFKKHAIGKKTYNTSGNSGAGQLLLQSNKAGSLNNRRIELFETQEFIKVKQQNDIEREFNRQ